MAGQGSGTAVAGAAMIEAEQKPAAESRDAVEGEPSRLYARRALRILIFIAYAAAGWGLVALLWFGLIA
jgi:hypothetical protein